MQDAIANEATEHIEIQSHLYLAHLTNQNLALPVLGNPTETLRSIRVCAFSVSRA